MVRYGVHCTDRGSHCVQTEGQPEHLGWGTMVRYGVQCKDRGTQCLHTEGQPDMVSESVHTKYIHTVIYEYVYKVQTEVERWTSWGLW